MMPSLGTVRLLLSAFYPPRRMSSKLYSTGSNMHNNDPEILEREIKRKDPHADSIFDTAPGWNEALASESEANIKAERHAGIPDAKKTLEYLKKRHHKEPEPTTLDDNKRSFHASAISNSKAGAQTSDTSSKHTSADYERDEVSGPLGSKQAGRPDDKSKVNRASESQHHPPHQGSGQTENKDAVRKSSEDTNG